MYIFPHFLLNRKHVLSIFLLLFLTQSYGQETYCIKGYLPDNSHDGSYIFLERERIIVEKGNFIIDSTKVKNRKFVFHGYSSEEPFMADIKIGYKPLAKVIIESGNIIVNIDTYNFQGHVSGTIINNDYDSMIITPYYNFWIADTLTSKRTERLERGEWTDVDEIQYFKSLPYNKYKLYKEN